MDVGYRYWICNESPYEVKCCGAYGGGIYGGLVWCVKKSK